MATNLRRAVSDAVPKIDTRRYTFIDYAMQAYLGIVGLLVLFLHGDRIDQWQLVVAAHAAGMIGIHVLISVYAAHPHIRVLDFLRISYPLVLVSVLYRETGLVNQLITGTYHDGVFVALEEQIFGFQPVVRFMETLPSRIVAEVLYMAYFSYYLLVATIGIALYIKDRQQVFHYVSVVSFVFYACYLIFVVFPVLGPTAIQLPGYAELVGFSYDIQPVPPTVESAAFYKLMTLIHGNYQVIGAAFPSSHVAVSVTAAYFAWRYLRRVRYLIAFDVSLLALATVYCRYHYAVDVIGGLITVAILIPLGEWLYRRFR
jgi:membrane-associated phospholipid phosphatase